MVQPEEERSDQLCLAWVTPRWTWNARGGWVFCPEPSRGALQAMGVAVGIGAVQKERAEGQNRMLGSIRPQGGQQRTPTNQG